MQKTTQSAIHAGFQEDELEPLPQLKRLKRLNSRSQVDYVSDEEVDGYRRKDESTQRKLKEFKRMIQKRRKHMGGADIPGGADFENDDDQIENHILSGIVASVTCRGEAAES